MQVFKLEKKSQIKLNNQADDITSSFDQLR
jgi:hypothetical protein